MKHLVEYIVEKQTLTRLADTIANDINKVLKKYMVVYNQYIQLINARYFSDKNS